MIEQSVGTSIMPERFTETLRAASEPDWSHAVGHLFVEELFAGAVPRRLNCEPLLRIIRTARELFAEVGDGMKG